MLTEHRVALPAALIDAVTAIDARVASVREEAGSLNESPFGETWRQSV